MAVVESSSASGSRLAPYEVQRKNKSLLEQRSRTVPPNRGCYDLLVALTVQPRYSRAIIASSTKRRACPLVGNART